MIQTYSVTARDQLRDMLRSRSVRKGQDFTSNGSENYYIDTRETTFTPSGLLLTATLFVEKIKQIGIEPTGVGGMELGAAPLVSGIVLYSALAGHTRSLKGFLVRRQPKRHGIKRTIEGTLLKTKSKVVIVDDVCTSGSSLKMAICAAREMSWEVLAAITLVDREQDKDIGDTPLHSIFTATELLS